MSRRLFRRANSGITLPASAMALCPGPPASRNTGSGSLLPGQRRHHHVVHVDLRALGPRRVERALHLAAQHLVADAGHAAGLGRRRAGRPHRPGRHQPAHRLTAPASASVRRWRSACCRSARAAHQLALDEHHRKGRPARPHLQRIAPAPFAEVAAVLQVLVRHAGVGRAPCVPSCRRGCLAMPTTSTGFEAAAELHVVHDVGVAGWPPCRGWPGAETIRRGSGGASVGSCCKAASLARQSFSSSHALDGARAARRGSW